MWPVETDLLDRGGAMARPARLQLGQERLARRGSRSILLALHNRREGSFRPPPRPDEAALGIPEPCHQAVRRLNLYPARGVSHIRSPAAT